PVVAPGEQEGPGGSGRPWSTAEEVVVSMAKGCLWHNGVRPRGGPGPCGRWGHGEQVDELARGGPLLGILLQTAGHHRPQGLGQILAIRCVTQNLLDECALTRCLEDRA